MKRFHISISTDDYAASVADYSQRLGCKPHVEKAGRYALWRTDILNFTISCKSGQPAGMVRHIGFEDSDEPVFRQEVDVNGIVWEYFSRAAQEEEIKEKFDVTPASRGSLEMQEETELFALDPRSRRG